MVTSAITGECIALLDGRAITAIRTAAASAVATDHLAPQRVGPRPGRRGQSGDRTRPRHRRGQGHRGRSSSGPEADATLESFRAATESLGIPVESVRSAEAVVAAADIVCTLTPAREPVCSGRGCGRASTSTPSARRPRPDHREVDSDGHGAGPHRRRQPRHRHGQIRRRPAGDRRGRDHRGRRPHRTGHVIVGSREGRTSDDDITLFESVGIGLQDLATAELVIGRARALGAGTDIDLTL